MHKAWLQGEQRSLKGCHYRSKVFDFQIFSMLHQTIVGKLDVEDRRYDCQSRHLIHKFIRLPDEVRSARGLYALVKLEVRKVLGGNALRLV